MVNSTFRSAVERIDEIPQFTFTASSAQFYEWVAESDPALLEQIRRRVSEGRWDPVGGWWVEPDVNMPSGEALIRQGLYGQLTFRRLLGRTAAVGYNPDSFGHAGTLPQILKLQGMNSYVFMRPKPEEKSLPADLFWWESPDGSRVLAYRIPFEYGDDKSVRERVWRIVTERKEPVKELMAFYGAGDHGGGATKANIQSIREIQSDPKASEIFFSTPDRYFTTLRKEPLTDVPVVKDDLQHHSVGCYTAESEMKKANRESETALVSAEKLCAIGSLIWNTNYPLTEFTRAWEKVLFLQFHDSLAGTALPEHYFTTAREGHGYALSVAHTALYQAAQKLAWQVPATDPGSEYLVAFNLQPWPVSALLEYDLEWPSKDPGIVEDEQGRSLPHQWVRATTEVMERKRLVFEADLPAFGYRQIRIHKAATDEAAASVPADTHHLENEHLRVNFGPDGAIQLFDEDAGQTVFSSAQGGAQPIVFNDASDTWSHGIRAYDQRIGAFADAHVSVVESGPLRSRVQVRSTYDQSTLFTDWILYAHSRVLEARIALDWHEHRRMLKLCFPVAVRNPQSTYEIAFGNIVRPVNGDENPGQRWIDVTGQGSHRQYGLAVINDAKYGYSVLGSDMCVSVVRGAAYANHQPKVLEPNLEHMWQDQGVQTFRLLLVPHAGDWREARLPRKTEEFLSPVPIIYQGIHPGTRPGSDSFLQVDPPNIVVSAIKKSEDGNDLIVRCYETEGRATNAVIMLKYGGRQWTGRFAPYEIKTIRVSPRSGSMTQVNALEE